MNSPSRGVTHYSIILLIPSLKTKKICLPKLFLKTIFLIAFRTLKWILKICFFRIVFKYILKDFSQFQLLKRENCK